MSSLPPSSNRRQQDPVSKIKYALKDSQSQKEIASEIEKLDLEKLKDLLSYIARSRHIEVSYVLTKSIVRAIRRHELITDCQLMGCIVNHLSVHTI